MPSNSKVGKRMHCDDTSIDVCVLYSAPQESIAEMIQQVKAEIGSPFLAYQIDMWSSQNSKESYACIMAYVMWRNPETSLLELRQFYLEFGCFPFTQHTDWYLYGISTYLRYLYSSCLQHIYRISTVSLQYMSLLSVLYMSTIFL